MNFVVRGPTVNKTTIPKHREMDTSSACTMATEPLHSLWSIEQLKINLKEKELPVSGQKSELVKRVAEV